MSAVDGSVFEVYQGASQAAGLGVGGAVTGGGVPADGDGLAGEHERDRALDRAGGGVAGLACHDAGAGGAGNGSPAMTAPSGIIVARAGWCSLVLLTRAPSSAS
jgi:hypothetical protein